MRLLAIVFAVLSTGVARADDRAWDRPVPAPIAERSLASVLDDVRAAVRRGERPVVVFDLDDTAIDGRARLEVAAQRAGLPSRGLTSARDVYIGLAGSALDAKRDAFGKHYFDDPALSELDTPQAGVRRFIREIVRAGGRPVYVSGRWESTRASTEAELKRLGIPLHNSRDLLLSPGPQMKALAWKAAAHTEVMKRGTVVAAFDNEANAALGYARPSRR